MKTIIIIACPLELCATIFMPPPEARVEARQHSNTAFDEFAAMEELMVPMERYTLDAFDFTLYNLSKPSPTTTELRPMHGGRKPQAPKPCCRSPSMTASLGQK